MMESSNETVADIVAEWREIARDIRNNHSVVPERMEAEVAEAESLESNADRIEAAWKREAKAIATENAVLPAVCITKSVGNTAKMREALITCRNIAAWIRSGNASVEAGVERIQTEIDKAFSLPARNCDVGTADEQAQRYDEFCAKTNCAKCPVQAMWGIYFGVVKNENVYCGLIWAQMPYEEGE